MTFRADDRQAAADQVGDVRREVDERRRAGVAAVVSLALAGDDRAREILVAEIRSLPSAFPGGLAAALEFHLPPGEPLGGLLAELAAAVPTHEFVAAPVA